MRDDENKLFSHGEERLLGRAVVVVVLVMCSVGELALNKNRVEGEGGSRRGKLPLSRPPAAGNRLSGPAPRVYVIGGLPLEAPQRVGRLLQRFLLLLC